MDNTIRPQIGAHPASRTAGPPGVTRPAIPPGQQPVSARPEQERAGAGTSRPDAAPALDELLAEGLGRAELPPPLELMAALEAAERHAPLADRAVPGLGRLIHAVIADERFKLARMIDLGR